MTRGGVTRGGATRGRLVTAAVVVGLAALLLARCRPDPPGPVHAVAVGGIACAPDDPSMDDPADGGCRHGETADLAVSLDPDLFLGLGDYQYEDAKAASYGSEYDPTWGRLRGVTRPAIGNQEYKVHEANTFFDYFGDRAGPRDGWYSYDAGWWHVVVLNSNCDLAGGCDAGSPQVAWLEADLAAHADHRCTLAYWHHPRFSDGLHGGDDRTATFWEVLDRHGADVVLAAHEHDYQRFAPRRADGSAGGGITSFVVGAGGQATYAPDETTGEAAERRGRARSEVRVDDSPGVLDLVLDDGGWSWRYLDVAGEVRDAGSATCR